MQVFVPCDAVQTEWLVKYAIDTPKPIYLRLSRDKFKDLYTSETEFAPGKGIVVREGTDITVIACGLMVGNAIDAAEELAKEGISVRVIDMFTWKPLDEELVLKCAKECGKIITCEEHSIIGGLGEAVCSYLAETCPVPVKRIGVNDKFGCSGTAAEVLKAYGLSAEHIVEVTKAFLNR